MLKNFRVNKKKYYNLYTQYDDNTNISIQYKYFYTISNNTRRRFRFTGAATTL